jgi:hypothetical protein
MAGRSQHLEQIMENQTRFDLNAAIENWRQRNWPRNPISACLTTGANWKRILRDAIAGFQQRGLNDEESFWLAAAIARGPAATTRRRICQS